MNLEGHQQKSRDLFAGTLRNMPLCEEGTENKGAKPVRTARFLVQIYALDVSMQRGF